jgi:hypothetical protein
MLVGTPWLAGRTPFTTAHAAPSGKLPPGAPVAAVYQPLREHLEVFVVDSNGVLNTVWKEYNGNWHNPLPLTGANFAPPGAAVAAVYYPKFEQLEVFVVDIRGALNVVWKAHDGNWNPPIVLTRAEFAPPGAPLAAVYQPLNEQLEVFVVDSSGALNAIWKANNNTWSSPPLVLTQRGFTKPGASVAAAYYPKYQQLEVFTVDIRGVFSVISKAHNGAWYTPIGVTGANFAPSGVPLAAVYQPLNEQLEVFLLDGNGSLQDIWKANNNAWGTLALSGTGLVNATPASVAAVYSPTYEQLDVFVVARDGAFSVKWKQHNGNWNGPLGVSEPHYVPGASVAAVFYPLDNHLEAVTTDQNGVLNVEWKVHNQPFVPCGLPVMGTPPDQGASGGAIVVRTERVGQLTGSKDPGTLPILNSTNLVEEWQGAGVEGVDLGANTEHNGRLHIFFGDTVPGVGPAVPGENPVGIARRDTDLVAWTDDATLRLGGFSLHPVRSGKGKPFDPFGVDGPIGTLPNSRTPTGAFSYGGRAYIFGLWNDFTNVNRDWPDGVLTSFLASKEDPSQPGPYRLEFKFSTGAFWGVQPTVVKNGEHPGLPESEGDGLVILGGGVPNSVHLAWMRLEPGRGPAVSSVRYYTGNPNEPWTPAESNAASALRHESEAATVIKLPPYYSSLSAAWLPDARQWIALYSTAIVEGLTKPGARNFPAAPIVARVGSDPWSWSDEIQVFNTCRDHAYGQFMHWPGLDGIDTRVPPILAPGQPADPGHAYGAFILPRFTNWNGASRELSLAYLMSSGTPYQVQVMRTQLRLPTPRNRR